MTCRHIINHVGLFISVITEGSTRWSAPVCSRKAQMYTLFKKNCVKKPREHESEVKS